MLAPVFPGCHVFCRPATYHGIEPPPVLPSLDKRAGIEPALSLLVAGGDPGFWHGPWPYLPGCAGEDHCRRQVPLYVLSHHHCAFTNIEAVAAGIYAALKASPMRLWTSHTLLLRCWSPSFRGVMSFVAQRPITESNRPPSYQASTGEPESNRHFLCWWPEVIPALRGWYAVLAPANAISCG